MKSLRPGAALDAHVLSLRVLQRETDTRERLEARRLRKVAADVAAAEKEAKEAKKRKILRARVRHT